MNVVYGTAVEVIIENQIRVTPQMNADYDIQQSRYLIKADVFWCITLEMFYEKVHANRNWIGHTVDSQASISTPESSSNKATQSCLQLLEIWFKTTQESFLL